MDIKKQKMLCAVKLWAISQGMEEITDDESHRFWTDIAFKKGDAIVGFITEFDRDDQTLMSKMNFSQEFCHYVYIVTDDGKKRDALVEKILPEYGIFCYSNPYGLGFLYQILKEPKQIAQ